MAVLDHSGSGFLDFHPAKSIERAKAMNPSNNDGRDRLQETQDRLSSGARQAADRIADKTSEMADTLSEKGHQIERKVDERWLKAIREYVQDYPISAVGIALAGGWLISRIFKTD